MKTQSIFTAIAAMAFLAGSAQDNNLVMNGSFETTDGKVKGRAEYDRADSISSSNNTTIDLYSTEACGSDFDVPQNYMGNQGSKTGNNYVGITAFYGQESILPNETGYQRYTEYIQFPLTQPLVAGKAYTVTFHVSLAERSAYAVSGLGVYFTNAKLDVENNAYLDVVPDIIAANVVTNTDWGVFSATYVASGGERYMTLGCFDDYMVVQKVIPENTNNSRKAYYFVDDVSVAPALLGNNDLAMLILSGSCYQLSNLSFETDKAVILPESFTELNALADFLRAHPSINVYIDGHTDKVGTDDHNAQLSKDRAVAVRTYLVDAGVADSRLKTRGYGESQPIDNTENASATNRRVEITICGGGAVAPR
jgi:outer membrane protein OmpA-like peptidoglycan-associated protein